MIQDPSSGDILITIKADDDGLKSDLNKLNNTLLNYRLKDEQSDKRYRDLIHANSLKTIKEEKANHKELSALIKKSYATNLKLYGDTTNKQLEIHAQYIQQIEAAEAKHLQKMKFMQSRTVTGAIRGRLADAKNTVKANLLGGHGIAGSLASGAAALGPVGLAIGATLGATVKLFKDATVAAGQFKDKALELRTVVGKDALGNLPMALESLRASSVALGKDLTTLQDSMYLIVSGSAAMSNNVMAAASAVDLSARAATAMRAETNEVANAMVYLGNALGLPIENIETQTLLLDTLVTTMDKGVITSGQELAGSIATAAPQFAALANSGEEALQVIGTMTTVLTQNGLSAGEASTYSRGFAASLLDISTRAAMVKAGLQGIDAETGKVSDWQAMFKSIGDNMEPMMAAMGGRVEASAAARMLGRGGGQQASDVFAQMGDVGGSTERGFETMSQSGATASARMDAAWNDMLISIGGGTEAVFSGVQNDIADAISTVSGWFKSAQTESADAFTALKDASGQVSSMKGLMGDLQKASGFDLSTRTFSGLGDAGSALTLINGKMSLIRESGDEVATEVERIMKASTLTDDQKYMRIAIALERAQKVNLSEQLIGASDATEAQIELMDELSDGYTAMDATGGFIDPGHFDSLTEASKAYEQKLIDINIALSEAEGRRNEGDEDDQLETAEEIVELNEQRAAIFREQFKIESKLMSTQQSSVDNTWLMVDAQMEIAKNAGDELSMAEAMEIAQANLSAMKENDLDLYNSVIEQLNQELILKQQSAEAETFINEQLLAQGVAEGATNEQRIAGLAVIKAKLDSEIEALKGEIAQTEARIMAEHGIAMVMQAQVGIQNELNKAQGVGNVGRIQTLQTGQGVLAEMRAKLATMTNQSAAVGAQIATARTAIDTAAIAAQRAAETAAGAASGGGGRASGKTAEEEAKEAEEERLEEEQRLAEEREEALEKLRTSIEDEYSARQEIIQNAMQAAADAREHAQEQREAWEEMVEAIDEGIQRIRETYEGADSETQSAIDNLISLYDTHVEELARQQRNERVAQEATRATQRASEDDLEDARDESLLQEEYYRNRIGLGYETGSDALETYTRDLSAILASLQDAGVIARSEQVEADRAAFAAADAARVNMAGGGGGAGGGFGGGGGSGDEIGNMVTGRVRSGGQTPTATLAGSGGPSAGLMEDQANVMRRAAALGILSAQNWIDLITVPEPGAPTTIGEQLQTAIEVGAGVTETGVATLINAFRSIYTGRATSVEGQTGITGGLEYLESRGLMVDIASIQELYELKSAELQRQQNLLEDQRRETARLQSELTEVEFQGLIEPVRLATEDLERYAGVATFVNTELTGELIPILQRINELKEEIAAIEGDPLDPEVIEQSLELQNELNLATSEYTGKLASLRESASAQLIAPLGVEGIEGIDDIDTLLSGIEARWTSAYNQMMLDLNARLAAERTLLATTNSQSSAYAVIQSRIDNLNTSIANQTSFHQDNLELITDSSTALASSLSQITEGEAAINTSRLETLREHFDLLTRMLEMQTVVDTAAYDSLTIDQKKADLGEKQRSDLAEIWTLYAAQAITDAERVERTRLINEYYTIQLGLLEDQDEVQAKIAEKLASDIEKLQSIQGGWEGLNNFGEVALKPDKEGNNTFERMAAGIKAGGAEGATTALTEMLSLAQALGDAIEKTITDVDDMVDAFQEGAIGEGVQSAGDLTMSIGKAFLSTGAGPLAVAGAVILGLGMVTKGIGKIIAAIVQPERSRLQLAEDHARVEKSISEIYRAQLTYVEDMVKLKDRLFDTATEQLAAEIAAHNALTAQYDTRMAMAMLSNDQLATTKEQAAIDKATASANKGIAETYTDLNRSERKDFLESVGYDISIGGDGLDTEDLLAEYIAEQDRIIVNADEIIDQAQAEMDHRARILDFSKKIHEELRATLDSQLALNLSVGDYAGAIADSEAKLASAQVALQFQLSQSGSGLNIDGMDTGQIRDYFASLDLSTQSQETIDAINTWLALASEVGDAAFAQQEEMINLRKSVSEEEGGITEIEANEQLLALYDEQLAYLRANYGTEKEILEILAKKNALQQSMNSEMDKEIQKAIQLLLIKRQEAIHSYLTTGSASRSDILGFEQDIIAKMKEGGASDEAINKLIESFASASYDKGTNYVPQDMLAMVHKGERILTSSENERLLAMINQMASNTALSNIQPGVNALRAAMQASPGGFSGGGGNVFNATITIHGGGDPRKAAELTAQELERLHTRWHARSGTSNLR